MGMEINPWKNYTLHYTWTALNSVRLLQTQVKAGFDFVFTELLVSVKVMSFISYWRQDLVYSLGSRKICIFPNSSWEFGMAKNNQNCRWMLVFFFLYKPVFQLVCKPQTYPPCSYLSAWVVSGPRHPISNGMMQVSPEKSCDASSQGYISPLRDGVHPVSVPMSPQFRCISQITQPPFPHLDLKVSGWIFTLSHTGRGVWLSVASKRLFLQGDFGLILSVVWNNKRYNPW